MPLLGVGGKSMEVLPLYLKEGGDVAAASGGVKGGGRKGWRYGLLFSCSDWIERLGLVGIWSR